MPAESGRGFSAAFSVRRSSSARKRPISPRQVISCSRLSCTSRSHRRSGNTAAPSDVCLTNWSAHRGRRSRDARSDCSRRKRYGLHSLAAHESREQLITWPGEMDAPGGRAPPHAEPQKSRGRSRLASTSSATSFTRRIR